MHEHRRAVVCLAICAALAGLQGVVTAEEPEEQAQRMAAMGELVRLAHTDEGWVTLGYRTANNSVGQEWMLLEVGMTLMPGVQEQAVRRESITLTTPGGQMLALPSQDDFAKANLQALDARATTVRDSINYFPAGVTGGCRLGFFTDIGQPLRGLAFEQATLDNRTACLGRLYFQIPGGIEYGRYFLNVKFANSMVNVPFKIMTKDELKEAKKEYQQMEKEAKARAKEEKKQKKD
jgi:hypothetical protein